MSSYLNCLRAMVYNKYIHFLLVIIIIIYTDTNTTFNNLSMALHTILTIELIIMSKITNGNVVN